MFDVLAPFLVMRFRDAAWPGMAVRWLLVSRGPILPGGYTCGTVSGRRGSSEVRTFSSEEWCDAQIMKVYEPALVEAGYMFTGESAVVMLDPHLVINRRWDRGWPLELMVAVGDAFAGRKASGWTSDLHWRGTQADYDAIKNKQPGVIYEITD